MADLGHVYNRSPAQLRVYNRVFTEFATSVPMVRSANGPACVPANTAFGLLRDWTKGRPGPHDRGL